MRLPDRTHHQPRVATLLVAALLIGGCRRVAPLPSSASSGSQPAAASQPSSRSTTRDKRKIQNLGYTDYSAEADDTRSGVTRCDEAKCAPGLSLYAIHRLCQADLIDLRGTVVHSWRHPGKHWSNCELLENGDLLVVGADAPQAARGGGDEESRAYVLRLSWGGEVVWKLRIPAHHDADFAPNGDLVALTRRVRAIPDFDAKRRVKDAVLQRFDAGRRPVDELSLFDVLRSSGFAIQSVEPTGASLDLFHANSVEWMTRPELAARNPLYALSNLLVCIRHQDAVAIFDWANRRLVWSWGPGEISGPHDATVLPNGNILLYDNGLGRDWSRVVELDPLARKIVWEYRAPRPHDFYSASRGSNQRLPNGNTLISESDRGRAFEVTAAGEIVWEFFTPHANKEGRRMTIVRIKRYPPEYIRAVQVRVSMGPAKAP